ncbi:MAG: hypothetical protein RLP09_46150 [Sandaracinaceae bacterium]
MTEHGLHRLVHRRVQLLQHGLAELPAHLAHRGEVTVADRGRHQRGEHVTREHEHALSSAGTHGASREVELEVPAGIE